jgi:8-oxo-dGTP pyrophosphatase MutT (NUDIX family)
VTPAPTRLEALAERLATRIPVRFDDPKRKRAAVAVVLAAEPDSILLIRRAEREGDRWSGQMAFPGGRWSPGDPDLLATARRETLEEVGFDLAPALVLGPLDDIAPRTPTLPPITVTPWVFRVESAGSLQPNDEVAAAAWVELAELVRPGIYRPYQFEAGGTKVFFPGYHLDHGVVWGMTERILTPLLGLLGLQPSNSDA